MKIGCVTREEREVAIGRMVEVILEAEMEDVSVGSDGLKWEMMLTPVFLLQDGMY